MKLVPNPQAWRDAVPDSTKRPDAWVRGYRDRVLDGRRFPAECPYPLSQERERAAWQRGWQAADRPDDNQRVSER